MASPTAMARCLRADARLMAAADEAVLEQAERLADNLVDLTNKTVDDMGRSLAFATVILMLAAAAALEADDG